MSNFIMPETGLIVVGRATNLLTDGGLNLWTTATNLTHWTEGIIGSSTVNREATEKIEGDFSCRLDVDSDNNMVYILEVFSMTPLKKHKVIIWYMNSVAGKTCRLRIYETAGNVYLKEDDTWNDTPTSIDLPNSLVWKKVEVEFHAHPDYSSYKIYLDRFSAHSSSIYFDKVSIVECDEFVPKAIGTMNFDSGSVEPQVDETLRGATSGSTAKVVSVTLADGTWGGGDAAGSISLTECEGRFHDDENIDGMVGGANILTVNHPDTAAGVDLVKNGEFSVDDDPPSEWSAKASALLTTEAGGRVGNCLMITEDGETSPYAQQGTSKTIVGKIYKISLWVKAGTEASWHAYKADSAGQNMIWINPNPGTSSEATSSFVEHTLTFKATDTITNILIFQSCVQGAGTTIYFDEISLYEVIPDEVVGDGKTLMVNSVVFVPTDANGDRLLLTDYDGNKFIDMKGLANRPNPIFFKKPRKLNGLKVAIIDSGKAFVYRAQK